MLPALKEALRLPNSRTGPCTQLRHFAILIRKPPAGSTGLKPSVDIPLTRFAAGDYIRFGAIAAFNRQPRGYGSSEHPLHSFGVSVQPLRINRKQVRPLSFHRELRSKALPTRRGPRESAESDFCDVPLSPGYVSEPSTKRDVADANCCFVETLLRNRRRSQPPQHG